VNVFLGFGLGHGDEFLNPQDGFSHFQENFIDVGGQSRGSLPETDLEFRAWVYESFTEHFSLFERDLPSFFEIVFVTD
jgi:hypothetical protein